MTRKSRDETPYTNYTLDECIRRGAEAFDWKKRWRPQPGSDAGPIKRGAGVSFMAFRSGLGRSSAVDPRRTRKGEYTRVRRRHRRRRRREDHDGADCGRGARRAAVAGRRGLGRHRSLSVLGRRVGQPHDDHDRLRGRRSRARSEEADRRERACRPATQRAASPRRRRNPTLDGQGAQRVRRALRAKSKSTPSSAACASPSTSPSTTAAASSTRSRAHEPDSGRRDHGHRHGAARGPALRPPQRQPLTAGYYGARIADPSRRAARSRSSSSRRDDGYGPFGAKSIGEAGIILAPAAVGNAIFNAIGTPHEGSADHPRQDSGSARMKTFTNANPRDLAAGA